MDQGDRSGSDRPASREHRSGKRSGGTARIKVRKIRYAVVGLGHIAQVAVLPAFLHARKLCTLAALVSDDPVKLARLGKKYDVELRKSYEEYDELLASGDVDAVYIALPNDQHRDSTVRAARAGVRALCREASGHERGRLRGNDRRGTTRRRQADDGLPSAFRAGEPAGHRAR
jgi:GFO/IDH/MocA oxidoreductase family protein